MQYLCKSSDIYFGLSPKELKLLAFQFATKLALPIPSTWQVEETAGKKWLNLFMKRHPMLSIRKPEATCLARATAFNRETVGAFFRSLQQIMLANKINSLSLWNMDESGFTTVQRPDRVIARRGAKQVGKLTSAERGQLMTVALAVSAAGNTIPPFFVFPRKRMNYCLLKDAPEGSDGVVSDSGWMQQEQFFRFMQHFKKYTGCSNDSLVLLLLDNHTSHMSINALDFAAANGINMLSLPPHCSHRLQPLDVSVFGPLKKYFNSQADAWMASHAGHVLQIGDLPGLIHRCFDLALTKTNVKAGFARTGIYPFNPDIFDDAEFLPSQVRDGPDANVASCVNEAMPRSSTSTNVLNKSLVEVRPLPRGEKQARGRRGRPPQQSTVLTSSPVREVLRNNQARRTVIKERKVASTHKKPAPVQESSSSEDDDFCIICLKTMPRHLTRDNSVKCMECARSVHLACAKMTRSYFICHNCQSE